MITGLWLSRPGDGAGEYGPVTLVELRLMVEAGLIAEDTLVRDARSAPRAIAGWPELLTALNTPVIKDWYPAAPPGDPCGDPPAAVVFQRTNDPDAPPPPEALDILALNRACEPERIVVMPPWYRWPFWRNLARYLGVVVPVLICSILFARNGIDPMGLVCLAALNVMVVSGWGWIVFVVMPKNWNN